MDTIIREAKIEDLSHIQQLSTELAYSDLPFDKEIDLEWAYTPDGEKYYTEKIQNKLCMVAQSNNQVIGYSTFAVKELPSWRLVKVTELENLFVNEDFRSQGIGKKLIDAFMQWSKQTGAHRACASVFLPNHKAIQFYQREGFKSYDMNLEIDLNSIDKI